jgi:hypothetical protein
VTAACPRCGAPLPGIMLPITDVAVVLAGASDEREGLLAWATVGVGPVEIAGLSIRLNGAGEIVVKHAARKDRRGVLHRITAVLDPDLDQRIRAAVIAAYATERAKHGRRSAP